LQTDTVYSWLRGFLDRTGQRLIQKEKPKKELKTGDREWVDLTLLNPTLSIIASCYALIKTFPERFPSTVAGNIQPAASIMGVHHEDWMRAYAVFNSFLARRGTKSPNPPKPRSNQPFAPVGFEGFVEADAVRRERDKEVDALHQLALEAHRYEAEMLGAPPDIATQVAEEAAVARRLAAVTRVYGPDDESGRAAARLMDGIETGLEGWAKATDLAEAVAKTAALRPLMTVAEIKLLRRDLLSWANVKFDSILDESLRSHLGCAQGPAAVDGDGGSLQYNGSLLGTFLPERQNLEEICNAIGIKNWRKPRFVPGHNQVMHPCHIADGYAIFEKMRGPAHAAILCSECGTGKTNCFLAALKIYSEWREKEILNGTLKIPKATRAYKPSLLLCPASVLDQFYQAAHHWWGDWFTIKTCYETKATVTNKERRKDTLSNLGELQALIDQLAKKADDPMVCLFWRFFSCQEGLGGGGGGCC
jgi:hypothetical protein